MHLVSVIIPTRNRSHLVRDAIESVLAVHREGFELEVIVVDDGSTDDTAAVLKAYPVRYLHREGIGAAAARNAGMEAAQGDVFAFLDDDDVWLPINIAPQLQLLDDRPEFAAAHAQVLLTYPDGAPYSEPIPSGPLHSGWIFEDLLTHWPQLGSLVVRASVVREVGGLDATLHSEEEWDWLLRIARRYPIGRIEVPVMRFRQRGDGDELLAWHRLPDTIKVFHRHTRHYNLYSRLRVQRVIWAHRGWYSAGFLHAAEDYRRKGDRRRQLRCLGYALCASPAHALYGLATNSIARAMAR